MPIAEMTEADVENFKEWVWKMRSINMFDPEVIGYPRAAMAKAENEDGALLYIPLQAVLMFDAIAPKPELTPRQEAMCLWKIGEVVDQAARETEFREVVFFCRDDRVSDICARHGFEEIKDVRVLRKKVPLKQ